MFNRWFRHGFESDTPGSANPEDRTLIKAPDVDEGWELSVVATDPDGGILLQSAHAVQLKGTGGSNLNVTPHYISIVSSDAGVHVQGDSQGKLGFYGTSPISKPAKPVTLDDVIAALVALGLVAGS